MNKKNMPSFYIFFGILLFLNPIYLAAGERKNFPLLKGPYLGQKPPGSTPELFAPNIISTCNQHGSVYFSDDGREVYFSRMEPAMYSGWTRI